jgi:hypothetical protein
MTKLIRPSARAAIDPKLTAPPPALKTATPRLVDSWRKSEDATPEIDQVSLAVRSAALREDAFQSSAGLHFSSQYTKYKPSPRELEMAKQLILNGDVAAVDVSYTTSGDELLTMVDYAVCSFRYQGKPSADVKVHRDVFPHWPHGLHPLWDVDKVVETRKQNNVGDGIELTVRSTAATVEREVTLAETQNGWVLGHGFPAPKTELFNMALSPSQVLANIDLVREIANSERCVYVQSQSHRHDLLKGKAYILSEPGEFTLFDGTETLQTDLDNLAADDYRGAGWEPVAAALKKLAADVGPLIQVGAFRAHWNSPNYLFFAHRRVAYTAGLLCLAAAQMEPERGFPAPLDFADQHANHYVKQGHVDHEFESIRLRQTGAGFRHVPERRSRRWIK